MTEIPDLSPGSLWEFSSDEGKQLRAIGWLGSTLEPGRRGLVSDELVRALNYYSTAQHRDDESLGCHECELCEKDPPESHGEFFVDLAGFRYVMPAMIPHYIQAHGYRPPGVFVDALEELWSKRGQAILDANPDARNTLPEAERWP